MNVGPPNGRDHVMVGARRKAAPLPNFKDQQKLLLNTSLNIQSFVYGSNCCSEYSCE